MVFYLPDGPVIILEPKNVQTVVKVIKKDMTFWPISPKFTKKPKISPVPIAITELQYHFYLQNISGKVNL